MEYRYREFTIGDWAAHVRKSKALKAQQEKKEEAPTPITTLQDFGIGIKERKGWIGE